MKTKSITLQNSYTIPNEGSLHKGATASDKVFEIQIYVAISEEGTKALEQAKKGSDYHLTYDELVAVRGASQDHLNQVVAFASENNLEVKDVNAARRHVTVGGTAEAISNAFGVMLNDYSHQEGDYTTHDGHFQIPESLSDIVTSIVGTNTRIIATRSAHNAKLVEPSATNSLPTHTGAFSAMQVAEAYNFPTGLDGSGETIGIVELSGGYRDSDLDTYFQAAGISKPSFTAVGPNNPGSLSNPDSADTEVALDLEVAGSVCPAADFVVYFSEKGATQQGFLQVLETAVHDTTNKPSVISISWGGPEVQGDQTYADQFKEVCNDAVMLGITILISSGDSGSPNGLSGGQLAPSFPASVPNVLACGGTLLKASGSTIESEVVWGELAEGEGASGGGVSILYPLPDYQTNSNVPVVPNSGFKPGYEGRGVPDIAGNGAPNSGYTIYVNGKYGVVGGTSAVAPLWAGLIILINQSTGKRAGFLNQKLYDMAGTSSFRDITEGTNGINGSLYNAGPGWDACTGLGSPDGTAILNALKSS